MAKNCRTILLATLLLFAMTGWVTACPTCKESVAENGGNLVQGYFWSILFMMSMPFLILSGMCGMFYLDVRRARRKKLEESASEWTDAPPSSAIPVGST